MKYQTTTYADEVPYTTSETDRLPEPEEVDVLTDEFAVKWFTAADGTLYTCLIERRKIWMGKDKRLSLCIHLAGAFAPLGLQSIIPSDAIRAGFLFAL